MDLNTEIERHKNYFKENGKPWITLKQNLSLDHHVGPANGKHIKLASEKVRDFIHHERGSYQAVLVGSSTAIIDNPNLLADDSSAKQPIRVVIDRRGRLLNNLGLNILNSTESETWIMTQSKSLKNHQFKPNVKVFLTKTDQLQEIIDILADYGVNSIYVEGGPTIEKSFMDDAYVNEIVDYFSPVYFGDIGLDGAVPIHQLDLEHIAVDQIDDHIRVAGLVK